MTDPLASIFAPLRPYAGWALRLTFGVTFIFYGYAKITGLGGFAEMMLGGNTLLAALVAFAEVAAGIGIIGGAFTSSLVTRLAGLAVIPVMLGAIFMVHLQNGFHFMAQPNDPTPMGGWNFQFVLMGIAVFYLLSGNKDIDSPADA
jgi:putative oxidoreductase